MEPTILHLEKIISNYTRRLEAVSEENYAHEAQSRKME